METAYLSRQLRTYNIVAQKKPRLLTYLTRENTEALLRLTNKPKTTTSKRRQRRKTKTWKLWSVRFILFFPIRNSYKMGNSQDFITLFNATVDAHSTHSRSTLISDVNWFWCAYTRFLFHTCSGWLLCVLIKSFFFFLSRTYAVVYLNFNFRNHSTHNANYTKINLVSCCVPNSRAAQRFGHDFSLSPVLPIDFVIERRNDSDCIYVYMFGRGLGPVGQ